MPIEVTMPRLSDTMEQGTVVKWNVKEGQKVSTGDVIADIETEASTMARSPSWRCRKGRRSRWGP
jgi:pyruvate dehydrogenase E2 component (dihydrolipoamide acetyltransferase)